MKADLSLHQKDHPGALLQCTPSLFLSRALALLTFSCLLLQRVVVQALLHAAQVKKLRFQVYVTESRPVSCHCSSSLSFSAQLRASAVRTRTQDTRDPHRGGDPLRRRTRLGGVVRNAQV